MNARAMLETYGPKLIGCTVHTQAIGDYPGGLAVVSELNPDPQAPEIVFQVIHPTAGSMGIFEHEDCTFPRRPGSSQRII